MKDKGYKNNVNWLDAYNHQPVKDTSGSKDGGKDKPYRTFMVWVIVLSTFISIVYEISAL